MNKLINMTARSLPPQLHQRRGRFDLLVHARRHASRPHWRRRLPPRPPSSTPGSRIGTDNTVTILCPTSEMGQGVLTVAAADPRRGARRRLVEGQGASSRRPIPKVYGNTHELFNGAQVTRGERLGSRLLHAAADRRRPGSQGADRRRRCRMEGAGWRAFAPTRASSSMPSRSAASRYGDVAKFAKVPAEPPKITEADLKKPASSN